MTPRQVTFPPRAGLRAPHGIEVQAGPGARDPPGGRLRTIPIRTSSIDRAAGGSENVPYDFLINATGPRLRFDETEGLGPDGNSLSVCTLEHAVGASPHSTRRSSGCDAASVSGSWSAPATAPAPAKERRSSTSSTWSSSCGPARCADKAEIVWITNEYELGDFGMGGMHLRRGGYVVPSNLFTESLFAERGRRLDYPRPREQGGRGPGPLRDPRWGATRAGVRLRHAAAAVLRRGPRAYDRNGEDITGRLFLPNDFMRVDADYAAKPYEQWAPGDWPRTYQSPAYPNIFAAGIAFAPPHAISLPRTSPNGTVIAPAPPRTGMPSAGIGKAVAASIVEHGPRCAAADPLRVHGRDGRGLRSLGGRAPAHRHRRLDDRVPDRPRPRPLPAVRAAWTGRPVRSGWPGTGSRSCCTTCSCTRPGSVPAGPSSRSSDHGRKRSSCPAARPARCRVRR